MPKYKIEVTPTETRVTGPGNEQILSVQRTDPLSPEQLDDEKLAAESAAYAHANAPYHESAYSYTLDTDQEPAESSAG